MKSRTIHIESRTERLIAVRDFVSEAAREFGFTDDDVNKIALAVDEACTNVIKHAYRFAPDRDIAVTVRPHNAAFEVAIRDTGTGFDPTDVHAPDMQDYFAHFRKGGLGVYLMKRLMDKVEYDIDPGKQNEVRLIKYLAR